MEYLSSKGVKDLSVPPVYNPGGGMEKPEATYGCSLQDTSHQILSVQKGENAGAHGGLGIPTVLHIDFLTWYTFRHVNHRSVLERTTSRASL
jgi:hypothetical protein